MGTSLEPIPPTCNDPVGHRAQRFLIEGACTMGTWDAAGLNVERHRGDSYAWRVMRCGCIFVALLVASNV
jgi:hypothetical protein